MSCTHEIGGVAPSITQRLIAASLRGALKVLIGPAFLSRAPLTLQRRWLAALSKASLPARGVPRRDLHFGSVPVELVGEGRSGTVLYLHGGGYVSGGPNTHRALTSHLARQLDATVAVVDYRLAPEYPCPAALDDAITVYRALLDNGHPAERIAVVGDSAGGGLALAVLQHLRDDGHLPAPAAGVLLSPWVDLTLTRTPERLDGEVMLNLPWLAFAAQAYAGNGRDKPEASPLFGNLSGLPPLLIQCGSDEILRGDSDRLAAALSGVDTQARYQLFPHRWHVFQLHAGLLSDSDDALRSIGDFLAKHYD